MAKSRELEFEGVVVEACRGGVFRVKMEESDHVVLARISGKIRKNRIMIAMGDKVVVELSAYDPSQGRIVYRW
jgi:translation initiation factor IF-1